MKQGFERCRNERMESSLYFRVLGWNKVLRCRNMAWYRILDLPRLSGSSLLSPSHNLHITACLPASPSFPFHSFREMRGESGERVDTEKEESSILLKPETSCPCLRCTLPIIISLVQIGLCPEIWSTHYKCCRRNLAEFWIWIWILSESWEVEFHSPYLITDG